MDIRVRVKGGGHVAQIYGEPPSDVILEQSVLDDLRIGLVQAKASAIGVDGKSNLIQIAIFRHGDFNI